MSQTRSGALGGLFALGPLLGHQPGEVGDAGLRQASRLALLATRLPVAQVVLQKSLGRWGCAVLWQIQRWRFRRRRSRRSRAVHLLVPLSPARAEYEGLHGDMVIGRNLNVLPICTKTSMIEYVETHARPLVSPPSPKQPPFSQLSHSPPERWGSREHFGPTPSPDHTRMASLAHRRLAASLDGH